MISPKFEDRYLQMNRAGNNNTDPGEMHASAGPDNGYSGKSRLRMFAGTPGLTSRLSRYLLASFFTILTGVIFYPLKEVIGYQIVAFGLMFTVSIVALFMGVGPVLLSATLGALIWDFFFLPPPFTLHVNEPEDVLMLIMFFIIALLGGVMTSRVRKQERLTRERELRTNALYQLTRDLSMTSGIDEVIRVSVRDIKEYTGFGCSFLLQAGNNFRDRKIKPEGSLSLSDSAYTIAEWSFNNSREAGRFTESFSSSEYTFYPLLGNKLNLGTVIIRQMKPLSGDEAVFWEAYRTQITNALEREFLNDTARRASILSESDKLYKSLFNSISHELRIPVATILGASDTLVSGEFDSETGKRLFVEINKASERLSRLIDNLLNMSRLESGRISPGLDWHDVHDLTCKVMEELKTELNGFNVDISIPEDMPLVRIDFGLIENVLKNLVLNSTQYSKQGTTILIKMYYENNNFFMQVMDRGPGFPPGEFQNVFNKFYRLEGSISGGTGLGLSIVKGFVNAHNGDVSIENRKNGGARITVRIPTVIPDLNKILS